MKDTGEAKLQPTYAKSVVDILHKTNFETFAYLSVQGDELIILLRPSVRHYFPILNAQ
jgi:hypothetical protein